MLALNRTAASALALSLGAFLACADGAPSPSAPDAFPVAYGKGGVPGGPGGGGGGGGGGDGDGAALTAGLADGLVAAPQTVSVTKDNKVALAMASGSYTVAAALDATQALASSDQQSMTACLWQIPAGAEGLKAELVAALVDGGASARSLDAQVDKRAADKGAESSDNYITLRADEMDASPVIFLGRNNAGTGNFLVFTFQGTNIHDAGSERVFTGTGGTVRVVKRFDADGDGTAEADEPVASVRCPNLDTVVLTVAPGA